MAQRRPDWDAIERDYRLGHWSNRELAARHGCHESAIRKKARGADWQKDLSERVAAEARAAADAAAVRTAGDVAHGPAIAAAVGRIAGDVLIQHRADLAELRALEAEILAAIHADTLEKVSFRAKSLRDLSGARAQRITLERQAWGLDAIKPDTLKPDTVRRLSALPADLLAQLEAVAEED